jgi:hypothetical protein
MYTPTLSQKITTRLPSWWSLIALLLSIIGLSFSQVAQAQSVTIDDDVLILTSQPTGSSPQTGQNFTGSDNNGLYTNPTSLGQSSNVDISVPQLGTYDLNRNSSITITGAQMRGIISSNSTTITAGRLQYRVYLVGTLEVNKPAYSNAALATSQAGSSYTGNSSTNIELLAGLTNGGTYVLDVRFQVDATRVTKASNGTVTTSNRTFSDLGGGDYFYANFYVTPPLVTPTGGTTTWQSTTSTTNGSTNWADPKNWSNGVPTATSDVIIPEAYATLVYPVLDNPSYNYEVKKLTLAGQQNSTAAQLTINTATLSVYGDIIQPSGGLTGLQVGTVGATTPIGATITQYNSTLRLAGADQIITGNLSVSDIIVAGSGIKSVINQLTPVNILAFDPSSPEAGVVIQSAAQDNSNGSVTTVFSTTGTSYIQLQNNSLLNNSLISTVPGQAETKTSYIKGVVRADRTVTSGIKNSFGNIGIDITTNHTPGTIVVYRVVGDALKGPTDGSNAVPIKRQYKVVGDDDSNSNVYASSKFDVVFHYLDSDNTTTAKELNGIKESNLTMFVTTTNGAPYAALNGSVNVDANTVTRTGISSLSSYTLTLGDKTNPLPVVLSAFAATRTNANALLTWQTASEQNNKGFEVQVTTDGVTYRTLTFVASHASNSVVARDYQYLDTEVGKTGVRYYRLHQIDLDGTDYYSPIRAVSFTGKDAVATTLVASPNPFMDKVAFSFNGTMPANGTAQVTLIDMAGRTVREQRIDLSSASMNLGDLSGLRAGLYVAKIALPDGTSKTVRIQKQ